MLDRVIAKLLEEKLKDLRSEFKADMVRLGAELDAKLAGMGTNRAEMEAKLALGLSGNRVQLTAR